MESYLFIGESVAFSWEIKNHPAASLFAASGAWVATASTAVFGIFRTEISSRFSVAPKFSLDSSWNFRVVLSSSSLSAFSSVVRLPLSSKFRVKKSDSVSACTVLTFLSNAANCHCNASHVWQRQHF